MKIQKAWTPEEKLKLANIRAILDELISAESAAAEDAPPPVEESVKKEEGEEPKAEENAPPPDPKSEEEVEKVKKAEEANADAEERIEELPPDDEEAISILKALLSAKSIKKAKPQQRLSPEMQALTQAVTVMKSMQSRLDEQGKALNGILEGMGITEDILKVEKAAPRQAVQPSANDILAALASVVKSAQTQPEPQKPEGMREVLKLLWNQ
jgi:hypothetical protein